MGAEQQRLQLILWIAFLLGVVFYPTALAVIAQQWRPPLDSDLVARLQVPCIVIAGAQTLAAYWGFLRAGGAAGNPGADAHALWGYAVAWALSEAVGMHGLVLGLLRAQPEVSTLFFTWAIALLLILRPPAARQGYSNAPTT